MEGATAATRSEALLWAVARRSHRGEMWQMDVLGRVHLADSTEVKVAPGSMTICVSWSALRWWPGATARPVCAALSPALARYGVSD